MNMLQPLDPAMLPRTATTLLQSLWQAAGIALVLVAMLPMTRRPRLRYATRLARLAPLLIAAAMTFAFGDGSDLGAAAGRDNRTAATRGQPHRQFGTNLSHV